ncbi:Diguanylate cyclase (GGDEF) domain protein [uncultured Desulfobacterium sp.]|uniref:diguanylate cyclase n=1 Tax=uncultured Desulfobacterium sp. TaxID=201089 RepID=A0A445N1H9_9BACT|nr:Diguanylate cyclase (GGDEF) domain protein [uncultured Desulfobacterium sp.]
MEKESINYLDENILVVDDETEFGKILVELLNRLGFKAYHVSSGEEGINELRRKMSYTFLVTDIVMPGLDGLELTKRTKTEFPEVCIIVMTGFSEEFKYVSVINAGATDFINKPFRIEELEAKIRRAIIERNIRQELKRLTITDSLTGLYNQRHFYARLKDEIIRSQRKGHRLGLILLDLDDFKKFNDTHGHLAGDEHLQKFGKIILAQIRQGVDSGYRYGGDEFAIILNDADEYICMTINRRISTAFKEKCGERVSMGYAIYAPGMTPEAFVAEADKNLYKVKDKKKEAGVTGVSSE